MWLRTLLHKWLPIIVSRNVVNRKDMETSDYYRVVIAPLGPHPATVAHNLTIQEATKIKHKQGGQYLKQSGKHAEVGALGCIECESENDKYRQQQRKRGFMRGNP